MASPQSPQSADTIPITIPEHVPLTRGALFAFEPFTTWINKLLGSLHQQHTNPGHAFHSDPYILNKITITSTTFFGAGHQRLGFVTLDAALENQSGGSIPGSVFLRGGSVAILLLLETCDNDGDPWVVLTVQPRVAAGSLDMVELPAGMVDDESENLVGVVAREIEEECGIVINQHHLIDLTNLALGDVLEGKQEAVVYPSPGACDETIKVFAYRHRINESQLDEWRGRLTGLRKQGEMITLKLVRLNALWRETVDSKALCAAVLWQGLKRDGLV